MTPSERLVYFFESINRNDAEACIACYEPEAVLSLAPNGDAVTGTTQISEALATFLALDELAFTEVRELRSADDQLALTSLNWTATGVDPTGNSLSMSGTTTELFRRQPDGEWLLAIDSPWWLA